MRRRDFIALAGGVVMPLALPRVAAAQQAMPVVGFLSGRSLASDTHLVTAFRQALNEAGYIEGQNISIEFRWADGALNRLPALAADLVARKVSVIFAGAADVAMDAVKAAASSTSVVFATGGDPVALGLVTSFNRPGGNLTGVTVVTASLWPKRLELLRELVGAPPMVAILINPGNVTAELATRELQAAARNFGHDILVLKAGTDGDFETAFATLLERRAGALLVADDALFQNRRKTLTALAARHSIPTIYGRREYAAEGGLISYGASTVDQYRQAGIYVGRILKGDKPADLPFLQPTKFELVINLKTAKTLGLRVPLTLQVAADEVIE